MFDVADLNRVVMFMVPVHLMNVHGNGVRGGAKVGNGKQVGFSWQQSARMCFT